MKVSGAADITKNTMNWVLFHSKSIVLPCLYMKTKGLWGLWYYKITALFLGNKDSNFLFVYNNTKFNVLEDETWFLYKYKKSCKLVRSGHIRPTKGTATPGSIVTWINEKPTVNRRHCIFCQLTNYYSAYHYILFFSEVF